MLLFIVSAPPAAAAQKDDISKLYKNRLEKKIHDRVNEERKKHKLPVFQKSAELSEIARKHSIDMIKRKYTSHVTPDGLSASDRAEKAGFNIKKEMPGNRIRTGVGENIFYGQDFKELNGAVRPYLRDDIDALAKDIVKGWMNSPGHRRNILDPSYTMAGTGAAISEDKIIKAVQVFF